MKTNRNEMDFMDSFESKMIYAYSNDDFDVELAGDTVFDEDTGEEIGWAVANDEIWFFDDI